MLNTVVKILAEINKSKTDVSVEFIRQRRHKHDKESYKFGDDMSGDLIMNGYRIQLMLEPIGDGDAATQ
ncbi:hypothetical protein CHS0354_005149 [Potamilus streckersoni]|uniref:Uncharacterized protein n=1 Tax=Potamilus streckersoni TaxID=2493646 RepID=A0AAE0SAD5_9BIVA|nr:hypothetical protein CHS0354_019675 [Potamilus streckersoni]KAK3591930.1 hypothetical protein CHS0354_005149 [Potamilus streckersoni]